MHESEEGPRTFSRSLVDGILGLPRLVTKRRGRPCEVCSTRVEPGVTVCPKCGYDTSPASFDPPPPPP